MDPSPILPHGNTSPESSPIKRKRGRPRKYALDEPDMELGAASSLAIAMKRKRGRPRKHASEEAVMEAGAASNEDADLEISKLKQETIDLEKRLCVPRTNIEKLEKSAESESLRRKKNVQTYKEFLDDYHRSLKGFKTHFESIKNDILETRDKFAEIGVTIQENVVDAAKKHHTALLENRQLYKDVQAMKASLGPNHSPN